jgi:hypothetical protein
MTTCGVDGSKIYYDLASIDLKADPSKAKPKSAFEAVFLGDVISEISGDCMIVKQQCKTQYPTVNKSNWQDWITSVDQENRVSIAHTIEKAGIPILYNTPRLCDPGIAISRNWNLKNYIETRLYLFKFVYNFNNKMTNSRSNKSCYPSVVFDFRPFQYMFVLDNKPMYVTQWITANSNEKTGAEGYTPHFRLSRERTSPATKTTTGIFDDIVLKIITGKTFGSSNKSIINQSYDLAPNNAFSSNRNFLNDFRAFIKNYDGAEFVDSSVISKLKNNGKPLPVVQLTNDVIRVFYYDLIHDKVIDKNTTLTTFTKKIKKEFGDFKNPVQRNTWIGAKKAKESYAKYKSIFIETNTNSDQYPAIFKTLGDLSQFIYAGKYQTIVASGDKMGIGTGLYVNAKKNTKLRCMMEDVITGFIVYTGIDTIDFTGKKTCGNNTSQNKVCFINTKISKEQLYNQIISSLPANTQANVEKILKTKPMGLKTQIQSWLNAAKNVDEETANIILNTVNRVVNYLNDSDIKYILNFMNRLNARKNITESQKFRISNIRGKIQFQLNNKNGSAMNVNTARPGTARPGTARPGTARPRTARRTLGVKPGGVIKR